MQTVSSTYTSIMAGSHWFETQLEIRQPNADVSNLTDDTLIGTYGEDKLFSISTSSQMLQSTFEIGGAIAAEIDIKMVEPTEFIPPMAMLIPYARVCNDTQYSEWLMQGVFFIDTRQHTVSSTGEDVLVLHGYDAMLKSEQMHTTIFTDEFDKTLVKNIAKAMGLFTYDENNQKVPLVDPRTWDIIPNTNIGIYNFKFSGTPSYAMRDTLRNIACAYAGWFIITEKGYLRLISVTEFPRETNYLTTESYSPIVFGTGANATKILV